MLKYKQGNLLLHKQQNYILDRRLHRDRLVGAMVRGAARIPMRLINGPGDSIAGRRMAERYVEVMPRGRADVKYLGRYSIYLSIA